jgi:hypothetical protein
MLQEILKYRLYFCAARAPPNQKPTADLLTINDGS